MSALTASVTLSPDSATMPKKLLSPGFEALTYACCDQVPPWREKT